MGHAQHNGSSPRPERGGLQFESEKPKGKKSVRKSKGTGGSSEDVAHTKSGGTRGVRDTPKKTRSSKGDELSGGKRRLSRKATANTNSERLQGHGTKHRLRKATEKKQTDWSSGWEVEPDVGRVADGVQGRIHRLKGLGNSIVPQIAEEIGKAIMKVELDSD